MRIFDNDNYAKLTGTIDYIEANVNMVSSIANSAYNLATSVDDVIQNLKYRIDYLESMIDRLESGNIWLQQQIDDLSAANS